MSYVRFGEQESDVYVFLSVDGGLECCGCILSDDACGLTLEGMLAHLAAHRDAGHVVPADTDERLAADRAFIEANP